MSTPQDTSSPLSKAFVHQKIEAELYQKWESQGFFTPSGTGTPFSIAIPPPNVTGTLHLGHAFQHTLMDAIIRYRRMSGHDTLWQPGTDHAGISTQMVVTEQLKAEGKSLDDVGREAFLERVWKWKDESGGAITQQMRRMGVSVDWSRERFTMDEGFSRTVREVFVRLYEQGLIYQSTRLVNWDPKLGTALSDLEVVSQPEKGFLWHLRYPLAGGAKTANGQDYVVVATTRPETMLGDTAVAIHPEDSRFASLIGKSVFLPLVNQEVPIIGDDHVDMSFGTGCLKITPAHDFNDYEIGQRHNLPQITVLNFDGTINENAPEAFQGLDRFVARERVVEAFEQAGLLEKVQPYEVQVPRGDRSGEIVEPLLTVQWFVDINELAQPAIKAVEDGRIRFQPKRWENVFYSWMRDIRDWCISRQQWWGHRIPAWYDEDGKVYVGRSEDEAREKSGIDSSVTLTQDPDVLETWFSSALWTFGTLGWPEETQELKTYHPTNVLVTGHDIIFFWIARMIMMTLHFVDEVPFDTVYITGLIRDAEGKKMSKTRGNGLDPLDLVDGISLEDLVAKRTSNLTQQSLAKRIEKATRKEFPNGIKAFGSDAVRFTFCAIASPSSSYNFDLSRVEGYHFFCNKLWNAMRYVHSQIENYDANEPREYSLADHWIRSKVDKLITDCRSSLNSYRFDWYAKGLYDFIWHEFCDWYLELTKPVLYDVSSSPELIRGAQHTLLECSELLLRLAHPAMPFITETLWLQLSPLLGYRSASLMLAPYPEPSEDRVNEQAETKVDWLKRVICAVRNVRGERRISPNVEIKAVFQEGQREDLHLLAETQPLLKKLAKLSEARWIAPSESTEIVGSVQFIDGLRMTIPFIDEAEIRSEHTRLEKELQKISSELTGSMNKLQNPNFVSRAPKDVVEAQREKASGLEHIQETLNVKLSQVQRALESS